MWILTHNVYWFQGKPSRWGEERVAHAPEVFRELMQLYKSVLPDIVCLQEVHERGLGADASDALGLPARIHAEGGVRPDYGGVILAQAGTKMRDLTRVDGQVLHERVHLRAHVRDGAGSIEIACVHLPSNRFAGSPAGGDKARLMELDQVLRIAPRPDVIVGDMNFRVDSLPYRFMREAGYTDSAVALGAEYSVERRVDYIWLAPTCAARLRRLVVLDGGMFRRKDTDGETWLLSDHPPLLAEIACDTR
jgi:endonuclease/exonuclease/phosphatase family metal-dependent hydrolase